MLFPQSSEKYLSFTLCLTPSVSFNSIMCNDRWLSTNVRVWCGCRKELVVQLSYFTLHNYLTCCCYCCIDLYVVLLFNSFLLSFSGCDIVDWLKRQYNISDVKEACYLATNLCQYGYIYPIDFKLSSYTVKYDRSAEYRFQVTKKLLYLFNDWYRCSVCYQINTQILIWSKESKTGSYEVGAFCEIIEKKKSDPFP